MTVRKKEEGKDVYEDVIEVADSIEQFTIADVDRKIAQQVSIIERATTEKARLETRKEAALKL